MERQFHNEDFERLLRDNANQYRMYPSEKVWKGVYSALHTRRRWYGLSALLLLLLAGTAVTVSYLKPSTRQQADKTISNPQSQSQPGTKSQVQPNSQSISQPIANRNSASPVRTFEKHQASNHQPVFNPDASAFPLNFGNNYNRADVFMQDVTPSASGADKLAILNGAELRDQQTPSIQLPGVLTELPLPLVGEEEQQVKPSTELTVEQKISALASENAPIQVKGKTAKVTAQVYFTPTVSYRKLSENKAYSRSATTLNPNYNYTQYVDVNNVVSHKPAMGLEVGIEGRYAITDKIAVKLGAQFNINRYDIRAYFHPTEFATIALNSGGTPDSLMTLSNYRNFSGTDENWLENFYFTMSTPIGAEFILADNKKIQWGVSGSVQPTYVIGDRAYLISRDYKNYAKVPNLMRRWNISTDIETFISYSTGRLRWQVGPQVRYQHLSSFVNEYPVKENLFDIGLKIGARINKK